MIAHPPGSNSFSLPKGCRRGSGLILEGLFLIYIYIYIDRATCLHDDDEDVKNITIWKKRERIVSPLRCQSRMGLENIMISPPFFFVCRLSNNPPRKGLFLADRSGSLQ